MRLYRSGNKEPSKKNHSYHERGSKSHRKMFSIRSVARYLASLSGDGRESAGINQVPMKTGSGQDVSVYRPVAVLSTIAKVLSQFSINSY